MAGRSRSVFIALDHYDSFGIRAIRPSAQPPRRDGATGGRGRGDLTIGRGGDILYTSTDAAMLVVGAWRGSSAQADCDNSERRRAGGAGNAGARRRRVP